jgi:hypothetical protein
MGNERNPAQIIVRVGIQSIIMRMFSKEMAMDHRKIEERSLALHREIARRSRANPKHVMTVRERLVNDVRSGRYSRSVVEAGERSSPASALVAGVFLQRASMIFPQPRRVISR